MKSVIPEIDNINRQLMSIDKSKKPKMLVVDDEPDNLDLLYRTFRRDFQVLRADSGVRALEVLENEGEVAVIISDQRMPEMKGTEFLKKTLPNFPNTVRIILTGFTDVEDLVEAINSGQVYKYITKPWDPNELKVVVQRAAETYEILKQRTEELHRAQAQTALLATVVKVAQEFTTIEACLSPIAEAFGQNFNADGCILQLVEGTTLTSEQGIYSADGQCKNWLADDPLTNQAIATKQMQIVLDVTSNKSLAEVGHYQASGVKSHFVIPITYRDDLLGILSLQWKNPCQLREDEVILIHLSAQQVAIALNCAKFYGKNS